MTLQTVIEMKRTMYWYLLSPKSKRKFFFILNESNFNIAM